MVNYCACGGCTNSSLSGHRVHRFPNRKKSGAVFRAWVCFVQLKRRDFTAASATKNAVVCGAHFRPEDYHSSDLMEFNMGCRSKNQVRLRPGAVPSVHPLSSEPLSAASSGLAPGGGHGHGSDRDSARTKRELCTDLGDISSGEEGATARAAAQIDTEQKDFTPLAPQSSVLHCGSQCNLRPSHRSSAVQAQPKMASTPLPNPVQSDDESSVFMDEAGDVSWIPKEEMKSDSSDEELSSPRLQESHLDFKAADKFIVCQSQLMSLFTKSPACCGQTQGNIEKQEGTYVEIKQRFLMCTTVDSGEIIILSDDDEDCEQDISCSEPSVLIVEVEDVKKKSDCALPPTALDEDLVVTFSQRAEVLPHARYDCPIHPFTATDCETGAPVAGNKLICDQCFCYICDKLASKCVRWIHSGLCHCNSHKRSEFWNNLRNTTLLGGLKTFNLTLSEIDSHLRHAGTMLQSFRQELAAQFSSFLKGKTMVKYSVDLPNQQGLIHDYTPVFELVSSFLNKADKEDSRAAAIMRLGAAEDFIRHFQISGTFVFSSPMANAAEAKVALLQRVISSVQRQMVMADFTPEFSRKLQDFYMRFFFPSELKYLKNSLCVRPWDDVLLVSVLKGQNVSGIRKDRGKKDVLIEQISVVLLRAEVLQQQHRYRELCRYLRVIQTDDSKVLQQVRDLIPFFMCMEGDFTSALHSLFPSVNAPASRFSPHLFHFYLCIFKTATAPKLVVSQPDQLRHDAAWKPIKDAVPLKRDALVKFALRAQRCCSAVFTDSQCWTSLLTIVNTPSGSLAALPAPNPQFLHEAQDVVKSILLTEFWSNIQIPRFFQEVYPDQALLLLVTGALVLRILDSALSPALPVLNTFKDNVWALEWLWNSLSSSAERLGSFLQEVTQEIENATDGDNLLPFLRALASTQSSSTKNWDHTYCSPVAVNLYSSQVSCCQLADSVSH